jgi:uncharacterized protein YjbJ (UPF0337 family)
MNSNTSNRGEGAAKELGGKLKKGVGQIIGNEQMEAEGAAKEMEGKAQQEAAKAAERGKGTLQELGGTIKNRVGHVIDNEQMAAEGKAKELEGKARQKANRLALRARPRERSHPGPLVAVRHDGPDRIFPPEDRDRGHALHHGTRRARPGSQEHSP